MADQISPELPGYNSHNPSISPPVRLPGATSSKSLEAGLAACVACRRRKVRCDKLSPCSNCIRAQVSCDFAARKRAPRRPRIKSNIGPRETELLYRLDHLEGLVKDLRSRERNEEPKITNSTTVISWVNGRGQSPGARPLDAKKDSSCPELIRFDSGSQNTDESSENSIGDQSFWGRVSDEVYGIRHLVHDMYADEEEAPMTPGTPTTPPQGANFLLISSFSTGGIRSLFPLPSQLSFYLEIFRHRVDPVIKVLHIPTLERKVKESLKDANVLDKNTEALMMAIFFSVITSLSASEVETQLGTDKKTLIDRFKDGTEKALCRASLLANPKIVTLQAFVIYIECLRNYDETRTGWALSRLAIGLSEWIGLHRDGSNFNLSPFDCEMRRRLWWQLCIQDTRNAEWFRTQTSINHGSFDTKRPLNINDSDIFPDSAMLPEARIGFTEMTFTLFGADVHTTINRLQMLRLRDRERKNESPEGEESVIRQLEQHMEDNYLQHFGHSNENMPYLVASAVPRIINKMTLTCQMAHRQAGGHLDLHQRILVTAIKCVELHHRMHSERTRAWHWHLFKFHQLDAVALLLREVEQNATGEHVSEIWRALDLCFEDWKESHVSWPPTTFAANLMQRIYKAKRIKEEALTSLNTAESLTIDERFAEQPDVQVPAERFAHVNDFSPGQTAYLPEQWLEEEDFNHEPWMWGTSTFDASIFIRENNWGDIDHLMSNVEPDEIDAYEKLDNRTH